MILVYLETFPSLFRYVSLFIRDVSLFIYRFMVRRILLQVDIGKHLYEIWGPPVCFPETPLIHDILGSRSSNLGPAANRQPGDHRGDS